jgi:hypothetical protein
VRRLAIVVAVASALVLSGCVHAVEVPQGRTDEENAAAAAELLEATWRGTGLDDAVRPTLPVFPSLDAATWFDEMTNCTADSGFVMSGYGIDDALTVTPIFEGTQNVDESVKLDWYLCFAQGPMDPFAHDDSASLEELEYLYDYYSRWVIPCIVMNGYTFTSIPTREQFTSGESVGWIPYYFVTTPLEEPEYSRLLQQCGPVFGALDRSF